MQRYFIDIAVEKEHVVLNDTIMHHLNTVLRIKKSTTFYVVDCNSRVFVVQAEPGNRIARVHHEHDQPQDAPIEIILAIALLKKDKFEWVVQKASELGVSAIVPFVSDRTIVQLEMADFEKKRHRYQSIATEACEQSHRKTQCVIHPLHAFQSLHTIQAAFKGFCYEVASVQSLPLHACKHKSTLLVIGPEGGFSEREVAYALGHGFNVITLGHKILRAETAAIAACAMIEAYHHE